MNEHDQISRELNHAFGRNVCQIGFPAPRKPKPPKHVAVAPIPILPKIHRQEPPRLLRCDKTRYPDKKTALTIVNRRTTGRKRLRRNRPEFLRAYHCPLCNGWHVTHEELRT